ncbi:endonuclease/exonuclease/phosphatase family protein [Planococcus shenhongbingii]|uniref:Endonuclease/exonuclease/phosphatase family protein n=1 Tax=Planococcus shenhongbingii TaxID=3058398 RepID=A0ABT8NGR2_9BACL|nr:MULTISPECIES: endonuclease/exonuclease/phosphatase family protein [unclassified Planococcus (in: firmicutes)]MDN7246847.1 endonuclease/exonuclease/phosphatase family protein [Planococcus sp. N017]WKA58798.1 endonuclease/exonuclease/phosphatase family protein [Planococcus sp. N016]
MEREKLPPTVPIKVMSFNIAHGLGMNNVVDLEKTASVIEQSEAEIVGLQELDRHFTERSEFIDQVDWLSSRLGMYGAFGANLDLEPNEPERPRRQYGNAVLSKHPIKYVENHLLTKVVSPIANSEQRGMLEVVLEVKGTYLSFFNTHLSLKEEELKVSIDEILEITEKSRFPKIITGDFNAAPDHLQIKRLENHYDDVFLKMDKDNSYTYPAPYTHEADGVKLKPVTRIDYIFTDQNLEPAKATVIETAVSDHLPIAADLVLSRTANAMKSSAQAEQLKLFK